MERGGREGGREEEGVRRQGEHIVQETMVLPCMHKETSHSSTCWTHLFTRDSQKPSVTTVTSATLCKEKTTD